MEQQQQLEVVFSPSDTQTVFLDAAFSGLYKYILFGGSIRGGKTYAALGGLLLLSKVFPGSRWVVIRDSLQNLKLTTIPSFLKLCPASFLAKFNQDTMTATFTNGSQILFFGEGYNDDKELLRFRGLECNGFVLEECNELQEATFYKAIERAGTWIPAKGNKPQPLILMTCNPSRNWVKTLIYDRHVAGTLPSDWLYVPSKITDNPYICNDLAYMESLKTMPTFEYQTMVEGDWELQAKTGLEFYKGFDIDRHTGDCNYDPMLPLLLSFDENVNPYLPVGAFQVKTVDGINRVSMVAEILGVHPLNTLEAVCDMILQRFPPDKHKATVEIYGDATSVKQDTKLEKGSNFFSLVLGYLKEYDIKNRVAKSNESVSRRGSWINAILEKQNGNIKFIIDRRCKFAINDMVMVKEQPDGGKLKAMATDPKTKVRYQSVGHLSDIIDYLLTGKFSDVFNNYKRGGIAGTISSGRNNDNGMSAGYSGQDAGHRHKSKSMSGW
jgi:hypothetical protein